MRFMYLVLKKINEQAPIYSKEYGMTKNEFNRFLDFAQKEGYISGFYFLMPNYSNIKVQIKGLDFLAEYHKFEHEIPKDEAEILYWIRYEGENYIPRNKRNHTSKLQTLFQPDFNEWQKLMNQTLDGCRKRNANCTEIRIRERAAKSEVYAIENKLHLELPTAFKNTLLHFSKSLHFFWHMDDINGFKLNDPGITSDRETTICTGGFKDGVLWGIEHLEMLENMRVDHEHLDNGQTFKHWKHSLLFTRDGSGNYLGIDLKYNQGEIIYLSFDGILHGCPLGSNFNTFFDNWIRIGCAGHFGKDFTMFADSGVPYINHESNNGAQIKKWLHLN